MSDFYLINKNAMHDFKMFYPKAKYRMANNFYYDHGNSKSMGILDFINSYNKPKEPPVPRDIKRTNCDDNTTVITAANDGDTVRVEKYGGKNAYGGYGAISISALDDDGDVRVTFPADFVPHVLAALAKFA